MNTGLTLIDDFFEGLPSLFRHEERDLFPYSDEFARILNGRSDFEELDGHYVIEIEVPGVKKDEIEISLKKDRLNVMWHRKREKKNKIGRKRYERAEGSFNRSFYVEDALPDQISAELKDGVLKITVPKKETGKSKNFKIEVK
jgi:HSP20 family protein